MDGIKIEVIGNIARVTDRPPMITSGTVGLPVSFTFDSQWDGLSKTAVFRVGHSKKVVEKPESEAIVPWELLRKPGVWLHIGVYGINADGTVAIPTTWANVCVIQKGVSPDGDPTLDPTLPVWKELSYEVDRLASEMEKVATEQTRPDWLQTDPEKADGIRNKPALNPSEAVDGLLFNDVSTNKAISRQSSAAGKQSFAGCKGYYWSVYDLSKNQYRLSLSQTDPTVAPKNLTWKVGDVISLRAYVSSKVNYTTITAIDGNIITLADNPFTEKDLDVDVQNPDYMDMAGWITNKPEEGEVDLGVGAFAAGAENKAYGYSAATFGARNEAVGYYSFATGYRNDALGERSHAEGSDNVAGGAASHAEGYQTQSIGDMSHTEGGSTIASGIHSHAEGYKTEATNSRSHAEGALTKATGKDSHAQNYSTTASGGNSHAEGNGTTAGGLNSHAEGNGATASGNSSHAEGWNTIATGVYSHAEGSYTQAKGNSAHTEGDLSIAEGNYSHAEGSSTKAKGTSSHSEGRMSEASGENSHAEGYYARALVKNSHAEGNQTSAGYNEGGSLLGEGDHAEGSETKAYGGFSHAEGKKSVASNEASHAEGFQTTASGQNSHSEGRATTASGAKSHAEGWNTIAAGECQHVEGKYNIEDTENLYLHIVGNGTAANKRSNAHTVDKNGNGWYQGTVTAQKGFILTRGVSYGTQEELDAITEPIEGQIFLKFIEE